MQAAVDAVFGLPVHYLVDPHRYTGTDDSCVTVVQCCWFLLCMLHLLMMFVDWCGQYYVVIVFCWFLLVLAFDRNYLDFETTAHNSGCLREPPWDCWCAWPQVALCCVLCVSVGSGNNCCVLCLCWNIKLNYCGLILVKIVVYVWSRCCGGRASRPGPPLVNWHSDLREPPGNVNLVLLQSVFVCVCRGLLQVLYLVCVSNIIKIWCVCG